MLSLTVLSSEDMLLTNILTLHAIDCGAKSCQGFSIFYYGEARCHIFMEQVFCVEVGLFPGWLLLLLLLVREAFCVPVCNDARAPCALLPPYLESPVSYGVVAFTASSSRFACSSPRLQERVFSPDDGGVVDGHLTITTSE